jgi:hypothetical protein
MCCAQRGFDLFRYLIDDRFHFSLYGRWKLGGVLVISYAGAVVETLRLPRAKWAVLALLMLRAMAAAGRDRPAAFMTLDELQAELRRRTPLKYACRPNLTRFVYDLRKILSNSKAAGLDPSGEPTSDRWGHRVIELNRALGYRISLRPENLEVHELDQIDAPLLPETEIESTQLLDV